jgi:peptide/nickel transport system permease protein
MKRTKPINFYLLLGGILTALLTLMIVVGFFWTPYRVTAMSVKEKLLAPSAAHWMGTDHFGRDIFSRVLKGAGKTLLISASAVGIGSAVGLLVGCLTGYFGGWADEILMRLNDAISSFPSVLLALVIVSLAGPGEYQIIFALGILFIPSFARLVRSEVARQRRMDYVENARLMGAGAFRVMFLHILPNVRATFLSGLAIGFNNAVLAESSLSYLGLGVQPPNASLGRMLSESQSYLLSAPWYPLSVGLVMVLLILAFSLLGEGLSPNRNQH